MIDSYPVYRELHLIVAKVVLIVCGATSSQNVFVVMLSLMLSIFAKTNRQDDHDRYVCGNDRKEKGIQETGSGRKQAWKGTVMAHVPASSRDVPSRLREGGAPGGTWATRHSHGQHIGAVPSVFRRLAVALAAWQQRRLVPPSFILPYGVYERVQ